MASWKNRPIRPGLTWCGDCRKWKSHKAFVRSRVRRSTAQWSRTGYHWKKFKSCNKCTRIYRYKGMSAAAFVQEFGAEEHNFSEPEILIDEDETQNIKDEDVKDEDTKDEDIKKEDIKKEDIKPVGAKTKHIYKRIKLNFTRVKTEDQGAEDGKVEIVASKCVKAERDI